MLTELVNNAAATDMSLLWAVAFFYAGTMIAAITALLTVVFIHAYIKDSKRTPAEAAADYEKFRAESEEEIEAGDFLEILLPDTAREFKKRTHRKLLGLDEVYEYTPEKDKKRSLVGASVFALLAIGSIIGTGFAGSQQAEAAGVKKEYAQQYSDYVLNEYNLQLTTEQAKDLQNYDTVTVMDRGEETVLTLVEKEGEWVLKQS